MPRRTGYGPGVPCWIDCISPELSRTREFYSALLGWEHEDEDGYGLVHLRGELVGGTAAAPPGSPGPAAWSTYLASAELRIDLGVAGLLGGRTVLAPRPVGTTGRLALALDPTGGAFGLWEGHADSVVLVDEPGALCGHVLLTPDLTVTRAFHTSLHPGLEIDDDGRLTVEQRVCARVVVRAGDPARWVPVLGVPELEAGVVAAVRLGARVVGAGSEMVGPGSTAVLTDPCGAVFGLRVP